MKLKQLFDDEAAVSPVIGVILMVAITVILAAVIGTFVLGLGDQVSQSQPSANLAFNYTNIGDGDGNNDAFGVTHKGGDKLDASTLTISTNGTTVFSNGDAPTALAGGDDADNSWDDSSITAGDTVVIYEDTTGDSIFDNGDTVRVIWSADNGDTAILAEGTIQ